MKVVEGDKVTISRAEFVEILAETTGTIMDSILATEDADFITMAMALTVTVTGMLTDTALEKLFGEGLTEADVKTAKEREKNGE